MLSYHCDTQWKLGAVRSHVRVHRQPQCLTQTLYHNETLIKHRLLLIHQYTVQHALSSSYSKVTSILDRFQSLLHQIKVLSLRQATKVTLENPTTTLNRHDNIKLYELRTKRALVEWDRRSSRKVTRMRVQFRPHKLCRENHHNEKQTSYSKPTNLELTVHSLLAMCSS